MRLVGIIAAHWELLDVALQRAVAEVMSLDWNDTRLLMENLQPRAKIDLVRPNARALPADQSGPLLSALNSVEHAYSARNKYVHSKWDAAGPSVDRPWRISVQTRGGRLKIEQAPTEVGELEEAAQLIFEAGEQLTFALQNFGLLRD